VPAEEGSRERSITFSHEILGIIPRQEYRSCRLFISCARDLSAARRSREGSSACVQSARSPDVNSAQIWRQPAWRGRVTARSPGVFLPPLKGPTPGEAEQQAYRTVADTALAQVSLGSGGRSGRTSRSDRGVACRPVSKNAEGARKGAYGSTAGPHLPPTSANAGRLPDRPPDSNRSHGTTHSPRYRLGLPRSSVALQVVRMVTESSRGNEPRKQN